MDEQNPSLLPMVTDEGVTNGDASAACGGPAAAVLTPDQQVASSSEQANKQVHEAKDPQEQLKAFWSKQQSEIAQTTEFKNLSLPLPRIKKIMKSDEDVKRIAREAPVVLAKACEMFVQELTLRAWRRTKEDKRRTLQKKDVAKALETTENFDFLVDLVSDDEQKQKGTGVSTVPKTDEEHKGASGSEVVPTDEPQKEEEDPYDYYYGECDCYSGPSSPDEPDIPPGVTCDDTRYYTYIHEYYSL